MKDTDFLTSTMRVRALEKTLMDKDRAERLIDARSDEEAVKVLGECGYEEMRALSAGELDRVLGRFRRGLYEMMEDMLPIPELLDVFRLRYDYHNVKALLKSAVTGEDGTPLLSESGRVPLKALRQAFEEKNFSDLPPALAQVIPEARELLARTDDPQKADFLLDSACLREMLALAQASKSDFLLDYTRLYIDVQNLRALVRAKRIGKDEGFLKAALAEGGHTDPERLRLCLRENLSIADLYAQDALSQAAEAGDKAAKGQGSLTEFEKRCDDALLNKVAETRYIPFGEQPILAYLLLREAEMTMLRTVLSGRMAGVPAPDLREKLRAPFAR